MEGNVGSSDLTPWLDDFIKAENYLFLGVQCIVMAITMLPAVHRRQACCFSLLERTKVL